MTYGEDENKSINEIIINCVDQKINLETRQIGNSVFYSEKINMSTIDINKIDETKLIVDDMTRRLYSKGTVNYNNLIKSLLEIHGYNKELWYKIIICIHDKYPHDVDSHSLYEKYKKLKEENELLNKYKDYDEDYLTHEERNIIKNTKKEIELRLEIEGHNILLDELQRIENNIDKLVEEVGGEKIDEKTRREETFNEIRQRKSMFSVLSLILSCIYSSIGVFCILKYLNLGSMILDEFASSDGISIGFGIFLLLLVISYFVLTILTCRHLMAEWYEKLNTFAYIAGAVGMIWSIIIICQAFIETDKGIMETKLGYSDPTKSYQEVYNDYQRLTAIEKFNRRK